MPAASLPVAAPTAPGAVARARRRAAQTTNASAAAASGPAAAAAAASRRRLARSPTPTPSSFLPLLGPVRRRAGPPPATAPTAAATTPAAPRTDLAALFAAEPPPGGFQAPRELSRRFGVEGFVEFYSGEGGLPLAFLHHPSGHSVEVYLQGATVTRWLDGARRDLLMPPRADAVFRRGAAISSGGAPLSFPQWREGPVLPEGGFSGRLEWEVVESGVAFGVPRSGLTREELEVECARRAGAARAAGRDAEDFAIPGTTARRAAEGADGDADTVDGLPADVEPYVVLRLRDSAATRAAGYPHAFELLYRVSLSLSDEPADLSPAGQQALAGAAAERRLLAAAAADGHDLEADLAAADRAAREGDEPPFEAGSARAEAVRLLRAAREARRGGRSLGADPRGGDAPLPRRVLAKAAAAAAARDEDAQVDDDDENDADAADQGAPAAVAAATKASSASSSSASSGSAAALIGMEVNRAATMPDAAAAAGRDPPVQLKLSLYARNNADGGSSGAAMRAAASSALKAALIEGRGEEEARAAAEAARREAEELEAERAAAASLPTAADAAASRMPFEVALLPHFATLDQSSPQGRAFVRARGLGGLRALDWSPPPTGEVGGSDGGGASAGASAALASSAFTSSPSASSPRLTVVNADYLSFGRRPVDLAASGAHEADVRLCPGDRSHYQILQRQGLRDALARHPGPLPGSALPGGEASARHARRCAALGAGRVVAPVRLAAGEEWRGELVVRRHGRYWEPAAWELAGEAAGAREPVPPLVVDPKSAGDR